MTTPGTPDQPGEGNLHDLTDDAYFAAIESCPPVYDAAGNRLTSIFDDVQDKRAEKASTAATEYLP